MCKAGMLANIRYLYHSTAHAVMPITAHGQAGLVTTGVSDYLCVQSEFTNIASTKAFIQKQDTTADNRTSLVLI